MPILVLQVAPGSFEVLPQILGAASESLRTIVCKVISARSRCNFSSFNSPQRWAVDNKIVSEDMLLPKKAAVTPPYFKKKTRKNIK